MHLFLSKDNRIFPLISKNVALFFYLRSAILTPSQLTRRNHGNLLRVWWNWGWSSSQQCCQTHECLFLRLGRQKPAITYCISWHLDKYLCFYLLSHYWQCVSSLSCLENLGKNENCSYDENHMKIAPMICKGLYDIWLCRRWHQLTGPVGRLAPV